MLDIQVARYVLIKKNIQNPGNIFNETFQFNKEKLKNGNIQIFTVSFLNFIQDMLC